MNDAFSENYNFAIKDFGDGDQGSTLNKVVTATGTMYCILRKGVRYMLVFDANYQNSREITVNSCTVKYDRKTS